MQSKSIVFSSEALQAYSSMLGTLSSQLDGAVSTLSSVNLSSIYGGNAQVSDSAPRLKSGVCTISHSAVGSTVSSYKSALSLYSDYANELSQHVNQARVLFEECEAKIAALVKAQGADNNESGTGGEAQKPEGSWFDRLTDSVRNGIDRLKEGIKNGTNAVMQNVKDCVSYWVDSYKEKGWVYKTLQTVGAVIKGVGAVAAAATAIAAAVASGGAAAPVAVAVLISLYSGNTVLNSGCDIFNLFGGNIDDVGNVNLLKSGLKIVGGKAGAMLGNEELGEKIGETIYTAGSIASTVLTLDQALGKVIQADSIELGTTVKSATGAIKTAWNNNAAATIEEAKYAAKGFFDIFTKSDISRVALDGKLLISQLTQMESLNKGMQLLNITKNAGIIGDTIGIASKLIDAGVDTVNTFWPDKNVAKSDEAIGRIYETLTQRKQPDTSFVSDISGANPASGWDSIKDIVESVTKIKDNLDFNKSLKASN